ncbi:SDR family oxidoreductase [Nocardioides donggukensis]|uniref:NAD(P)H-binding protein n=1 Tax=Nocardioides donggukensis TaxID=2774019 RepID=A0A927Q092_9ACTN|nr:NAD(P)H-binding protein [Nocardioides donggukensis]MBD8868622.1 NAD(P)H-binding protein [Nocardioides donggukensis]
MTRVGILGGTGKTGRAVARALAARGAVPVPLGRAQWPDLSGALRGCAAAYLIAPNLHPDEPAHVSAILAAARAAGVGRVVHHSVAAPYAPDLPHHLGKARAEDLVRRSGLAWTILQPGAYLQNLPLDGSTIVVPYRLDAPFGFAHLDDLAEVAATVLLDEAHAGATYELASWRGDVSGVAAAVGAATEVLDPEEWARTDGAGLDERQRSWLLAMFAYYEAHGLPVGTVPMTTLLGRTPTAPARVSDR